MMGSLIDTRDAIIAHLEADTRLPGVNVSFHGGELLAADLQRYSKQAPHLVLCLLEFRTEEHDGSIMALATWGLAALTKTEDKSRPRRDSVIDLADAVTRSLYWAFPGDETRSRPQNFKALNEYDLKLDGRGLALWACQWQQQIELEDVPFEDFDDLLDIAVDYETYTRDGETLGDAPEAQDLIATSTLLFNVELEDESGELLLESGDLFLQESA